MLQASISKPSPEASFGLPSKPRILSAVVTALHTRGSTHWFCSDMKTAPMFKLTQTQGISSQ
jgi:hypothetical protein